MLVIATLATIVASQAMISGAFSVINQSCNLGCFPRVKVIYTSTTVQGQIYIPEVNYTLMILCIAVVVGFRKTTAIGNAYGKTLRCGDSTLVSKSHNNLIPLTLRTDESAPLYILDDHCPHLVCLNTPSQ